MFLNLTMLAGLAGALVPLILHFLARARCRDVEWGAMMFLSGMDPRHAQHARLRQWTLLGLRMLLVGLLAIALARPVLRSRWTALGMQNRVSAVILLDCSYSMALEEAGRTRFDKAREAALQILSSLRRGDEVSLVLMGDPAGAPAPSPPSSDLQAVARTIADLRILPGAADVARGLERAREVLDQPTFNRREIYIVTDRQAVTWAALQGNSGTDFRKWLNAEGSTVTRLYVLPVGGEESDNVAIESVDLVESVAVRNQLAEVEVRLRNHSTRPQALIELSLWSVGPNDPVRPIGDFGRQLKTTTVTVGADATATVRLPVTLDQVGSHVIRARIKSPGLELDNTFSRAIDVIDPVRVLIVSGDERGPEPRRESFFLRLALAPYAASQRQQPQTQPAQQPAPKRDANLVSVLAADRFTATTDLSRYDVIVLANVPQFAQDQARALEQRVYEGGGLIVCPGSLARVDNYNAMLYREGQGILPARLENALPPDGSRATTLLGMDLEHPVFRFRRGTDPLPGAVVGRYFPAIPRPADARKLATLASGDPFLIEGPRGRGTVILVTTPLDADWNTLPLYPFYLPFAQSLVRYACTASLSPRNVPVGEQIVIPFDETVDESRIELTRDGERISATPLPAQNQQLRFTETNRPGIYRLHVTGREGGRGRGRRPVHFVVQMPLQEADLHSLTGEEWDRLARNFSFELVNVGTDQPLIATLRTERGGRELWLPLVLAVMALGVGEMWLSRRWSAGGMT